MQKSTMRIEDACIWRKALAEHPDETMTTLLVALRRIVAMPLFTGESTLAQQVAANALIEAGFETGIKESK